MTREKLDKTITVRFDEATIAVIDEYVAVRSSESGFAMSRSQVLRELVEAMVARIRGESGAAQG